MTRILRLEMKGFKSFANKTELLFGEKFNCILGPNGSGKSNVLDALCFVLGKASAKGLRAEKSANLIYNGGKTRSPAKEGSVAIVFDNSREEFGKGFAELVVTRIVRANGQSAYRMNGRNVTRNEILDMLAKAKINPDGYNIILQGDIVQMVEMSPLDRRGIIEQIAGMSVYEEKKLKALRELERVEQKLNEAEIILVERKTYLKELKKERDQAAKFKDLQDKIKRNKKTVVVLKLTRKRGELGEFEKKVGAANEQVAKHKKKVEELRKEADTKRLEIEEINKEVERRGEKEQVQIHRQVERLRIDVALKKQRIEGLDAEIRRVKERKEELKRTNKDLFDKIKLIEEERTGLDLNAKSYEKQLAQLETALTEFKKKNKMDDAADLDKTISELDKKAEAIQEELAKLREEQQNVLREKDKLEIRLESADEQIRKVLDLEKANKAQVDELKQKQENYKKVTKELSTAVSDDAGIASQLGTARTKLESRQEELSKLQVQQSTIREGVAGGFAVQRILEQKNSIKGIHGTVAELGSVQEQYALALEVAAGPRMTSIIVENDQVAAECIAYLRKNKSGVATFLPLNKIRPPEKKAEKKGAGILGSAVSLVSYDARYSKVFEYVFGATLVVDTLENARKLGIGSDRMVTLSGDLIETSGAMQGGFRERRQGIGFQQKEVVEKIRAMESEVADLFAVKEKLEQRRRDNEELITRLRTLKADLEGDIARIEKALHLDSKDLDMNREEKKKLTKELDELAKKSDAAAMTLSAKNRELAQFKIEKQKLRDELTKSRSPALLAQLTTYEEKRRQLTDDIVEARAKQRGLESEVKSVLGPESERITQIQKQQEKEIEGFSKEQDALTKEIGGIEQDLAEKEEAEKKFMAQFKELFAKRTKLSDAMQKAEYESRAEEEKMRAIEQKNVGVSLEIARVKAEIAGLEVEEQQYPGVEPFEGKPEEDVLLEIKQFERLLEDVGAVNMKALEIYETVAHEYEELVKKKEKLTSERGDVLIMINSIDDKKKDLFLKTFSVVGENFKQIFEMLSTKGQAYLELEDEKDPFRGGLTMKVRIVGNKFLDIRSLSGGEKTLTALAFLFAIQEYEPASFYILDEVDAALDKHNSEKLAKLIRAYCRNAQYVIISHNDGIIAEADNLYGVSMNEHGMSKITSLKI